MDEIKDFFANDRKENLNSTCSNTTKRLSILKPMPDDFAFEDTRMRKARRVSFAEKIQIKTIDESLHDASKKENDELLKANTEYNSKTQTKKVVLFDVSNKNVESKMDQNEPMRRVEDTSCDMEIDEGNSIVSIQMDNDDEEPTLLQMSSNNTIDCSMSILTAADDTAMSMDSPPRRINDKQTASQANVTYESVDIKSITHGNICSLTQTIDMANQTGDNIHMNATLHMSNKTMNSLVEPSILTQNNLTRTICKETDDVDASQVPDRDLNATRTIPASQPQPINRTFDVSVQLTQNYGKESFYDEKSLCRPHPVPTLPSNNILNNTSVLNTTNNTTANNLSLMAKIQYMEKNEAYLDAGTNSGQQAYESLKSRLLASIAKMKTQSVKFKELEKSTPEEFESLQAHVASYKDQCGKLKTKNRQIRDEINRLAMDTLKAHPNINVYQFTDADLEKKQKEVQQIKSENEKIQKDFEQQKKNYELMKEKLEDNMDVIKSLQRERDQKERLKNLFEKMFCEKNIPFKLAYFTSDCIVLLVFNDLIKVEIKGTNLVKDLNVKLNIHDLNDVAELEKQQKNLNYPLESICIKSNIDSNGHFTLPMHGNLNLPVKHKKKVPAHIKYCVELILGEIGVGDIVSSRKKYKYLRDLPFFIAHLNLACKYATKLALDLEHITAKIAGSLFRFEFDSRNFIVSAVLPSLESHCFYRLNMSVKPGCYYQHPIVYSIDQKDLDEPFEPDVERIRAIIENRCFEDGSIRSYLKDLIEF